MDEAGANESLVVRVKGVAGPTVRAALADLNLVTCGSTTELRPEGNDQATLHSLMQRVEELGLEVIDVRREHKSPDQP